MTSASYRSMLLFSCAALAFALPASASDAPNIEIHLEVLSQLSQPQTAMVASNAPLPGTDSHDPVFGGPTPAPAVPVAEDEPAPASPPKPVHKHAHTAQSHVKAAPVAAQDASPSAGGDTAEEAPPRLEATAPASSTPAAAVPEASSASQESATPAAQEKAAEAVAPPANATPALTTSELTPAPAPSVPAAAPHKGLVSKIENGFSDFLSSDSGAPKDAQAAAAKPESAPPSSAAQVNEPAAPKEIAAAPAQETPSSSPDTAGSAQTEAPPPLSSADSAAKSADMPPPLTSSAADRAREAGRNPDVVLASNDVPPPARSSDADKPDLPPPGAPVAMQEPAQETAQNSLTPLPGQAQAPADNAASPAPATPAATPAAIDATPPTPAAATAAPQPAAASGPAPNLRILFNISETDIPLASTGQLDEIAKFLTAHATERVTIMAYASGSESSGIYPKRVSLARGIAVRNYLTTTKGIDIERVNVKALGNKYESGPGDRVDMFLLQ